MKTACIRLTTALLAVTLLVEVMLRGFIVAPSAIITDAELGWLYEPNAEIINSQEGYTRLKMDTLGFNNNATDTNNKQVVVFGDSFTEALQVKRENNFVSLTNQELQCLNFYNAGRSGMSPADYLILHNRLSSNMEIHGIALILTQGDLADLNQDNYNIERNPVTGNINNIKLHSRPHSKIRLAIAPLFHNSSLAILLKNRMKIMLAEKPEHPINHAEKKDNSELSEQNNLYPESIEIVNYVVSELHKIADVSIFFIPSYNYKSNRQSKEEIQSNHSRNAYKNIAENQNIPFIAIAGLDEFYKTQGQPPVGFNNTGVTSGHLNEQGHAIVANNIISAYQDRCKDTIKISL